MKSLVNQLLNIRPHESSLVFRLMGVQFLMGLGIAFLITASYTFFLLKYSIPQLPWVYIATAILLFPINAVYSRLDQMLNSFRLMQGVLLFSSLSVSLFLAAWFIFPSFGTAVLLVGWNIVVYMLIGYAFWGMASLLFDVRESRRVFSVIGAGDLPAKLLGYLAISLLAKKLPVEVLMGAAVIFFLLAAWLAHYSLGRRRIDWDNFELAQHSHHPAVTQWWTRFFGSRLIMVIAALSFVAYLVFYIMDFTFMSEIKGRNKSAAELTAFLAMFFGVGRVTAIIFKLIFSSRFLSRMGLISALLVTPLALSVVAMIILLSLSGGQPGTLQYLYLFGVMSLLSEVLRSVIQEPVFFVLFQPLDIHLRLKGHLIAKGYVLPPALFLIGSGLLWRLNHHAGLNMLFIISAVLVLLALWMLLIPWIRTAYFQAVSKSIGTGIFSGAALFLTDKAVREALLRNVEADKPLQVIHALDLLERSDYPDYQALLLQQLVHPSDTVKQFALERMALHQWASVMPDLHAMKAGRHSPGVEKQLLRTMLAIDPAGVLAQYADLQSHQGESRQVVLEALLISGAESGRRQLRELSLSEDPEHRRMAASAIGNTVYAEGGHLVESLAADAEMAVRSEAVRAAGALRIYSLVPLLIAYLEHPPMHEATAAALSKFGDMLFDAPAIRSEKLSAAQTHALMRVAATIHGPFSTGFMVEAFRLGNIPFVHAAELLWKRKEEDLWPHRAVLLDKMTATIERCQMKWPLLVNLEPYKAFQPLAHSLETELEQEVIGVLQISGLVYGKDKLSRVIEIFQISSHANLATALELVELALPPKLSTQACRLVEHLLDRKKGVPVIVTAGRLSLPKTLEEIFRHSAGFSSWTLGLACYLAGKYPQPDFADLLTRIPSKGQSPLVAEARQYMAAHCETV